MSLAAAEEASRVLFSQYFSPSCRENYGVPERPGQDSFGVSQEAVVHENKSGDEIADPTARALAKEISELCEEGPRVGQLIRLRAATGKLRELIDDGKSKRSVHIDPTVIEALFDAIDQVTDLDFGTAGATFGLTIAAITTLRNATASLADLAAEDHVTIPE